MEDDEVENADFDYSDRAPDDWVSSGPLGTHGAGPGRRFMSWRTAEAWAREFYGVRYRGRIPEAQREGANRWAFRIRGKGHTNVSYARAHDGAEAESNVSILAPHAGSVPSDD